jgi:hypothetical protein
MKQHGVQNFYTYGSFLSLTAAAAIVTVVVTAISNAFSWSYHPSFPLFVALLVSLLGDRYTVHEASRSDQEVLRAHLRLPLVFLNGCLIYTTSVGGASAFSPPRQEPAAMRVTEVAEEIEENSREATRHGTSETVLFAAQALGGAAARFRECIEDGNSGVVCQESLPEVEFARLEIQMEALSPEERLLGHALLRDFDRLQATAPMVEGAEVGLARLARGLKASG